MYRGSEDSFTSAVFHNKFDNMGPTLAIIKSEAGYIFGGFTNLNWDVSNKYVFDSKKSFIFSLTNQSKHLNIS